MTSAKRRKVNVLEIRCLRSLVGVDVHLNQQKNDGQTLRPITAEHFREL